MEPEHRLVVQTDTKADTSDALPRLLLPPTRFKERACVLEKVAVMNPVRQFRSSKKVIAK